MHPFNLFSLLSVFGLLFNGPVNARQSGGGLTLTIDTRTSYQTIDNFGASDAWACQFVGQWPDAKRNAMADWLFSMDTTSLGDPKGIGLSLWRFNLGGGSTQQGSASGIRDEWRRAESFLEADGQYNWNRQAGQQWFLAAARQRGVRNFLAFYNSPPVPYTKNGKAFASLNGETNIDSTQYGALADYTVKALQGLQEKTGIRFNYLSPVNEPQWDWSDGGQEGCPYTNRQISGLVKVLTASLRQAKLGTKILVTESGHLKYLLRHDDKPGKGQQIADLFQAGSSIYIGKLPGVAPIIAGHSYFSTSPYAAGVSMRKELSGKVASVKGLSFWQSEYCILGDNDGEINGSKRDTGMRAALYVARTIHTDLVVANATAWQWWLAISAYDYKDGLIYVDKNKTDGRYYDSKMLWALGNYSRFVRPGMQRVATALSGTPAGVYVSAYRHPKTGQLVAIIVNTGKEPQQVTIQAQAGKKAKTLTAFTTYTTNTADKLARRQNSGALLVQPESIVTVVAGKP